MQAAPSHDEPGPWLAADAPQWRGAWLRRRRWNYPHTVDSWIWPKRRCPRAAHGLWSLPERRRLPIRAATVERNNNTLAQDGFHHSHASFLQIVAGKRLQYNR